MSRILLHSALVVLGLIAGLIAVEGLLRLCGLTAGSLPVQYDPSKFFYQAPYVGNAATGWQLKPGDYLKAQGERGRPVKISINLDASRATRKQDSLTSATLSKIVFVGDSFTFGEGLDDEETLPWRVQELLSGRNVLNHGIGGFGTCQTMLRLEQLKGSLSKGDTVIYGFSSFHEERNTADPRQDYWVAIASPNHRSGYPRCKLNGNQIDREDSREWQLLMPFTGRSVISRIITNAWLGVLATESRKGQRDLTFALLAGMRNISAARESSFIVLLQDFSANDAMVYQRYFDQSGINYLDGTDIARRRELKLPDGHPGPEMTALWANYLSAKLTK